MPDHRLNLAHRVLTRQKFTLGEVLQQVIYTLPKVPRASKAALLPQIGHFMLQGSGPAARAGKPSWRTSADVGISSEPEQRS
jgi:hypothetical protein